jgi:hypothetical protein
MKLFMKRNNEARIELENTDEWVTIQLALKYYVEDMKERGWADHSKDNIREMYENAVNAQQAIDPNNALRLEDNRRVKQNRR